MNTCFEKIKKNFGFGFMRLPMIGEEIDVEQTTKMVDAFMAAGFNYFDTAHPYLHGRSELTLKQCLTSRYPQEDYVLANKLSGNQFDSNEEIRPLFQIQLDACGVEYFDFYLMHAQNAAYFEKYKRCRAYETVLELKAEGKVRHLAISFHDKAQVLDQILTEYPQIEAVQLQLNYMDFEDPVVEARKCLEVCQAHGKRVIVMEPVKGGLLVNLPDNAQAALDNLDGGSNASYAIRFAASQKGVFMVLSGMSTLEQVQDNIRFMADFQPLNDAEYDAIGKVREAFRALGPIPCTACRYCVSGCPQGIPIPRLFSLHNSKQVFGVTGLERSYERITENGGKASSCVGCGACEDICPQHLSIRELLKKVSVIFE